MKKFIYVVSLCISTQAFPMSKQYSGGEVYITYKMSNPCFYINNQNLTGDYDISLFERNTSTGLSKLGSLSSVLFSKRYPNKMGCISTKELYDNKLIPNKAYLIVLETNSLNFGYNFCISEQNGKKSIHKFTDHCESESKSLWKRLIEFLGID